MKYTVDYILDKNIIYVKMKGRLSFQIAEQYSKEAVKLARQNQCTNFIFDHTKTILQEGVYKIHMEEDELQQFGFKNTDRISIIIANQDNDNNLIEDVSKNSRWSTLKYFSADKIQEAFNWLLK